MPRARKRPPQQGQEPDPRGGPREGQPGKPYPNRSDLRTQGQPIRTAPGQEYGKATAQREAQKVVPIAAAPSAPKPDGTPAGGGASTNAAGWTYPPNYVPPEEMPSFGRATERPDEPLTAGLSLGPGPGPDALPMNQPAADPDAEQLRPYLPTLELMVSRPDASVAARNWVRRLRGGMPPAG